MGNKTVDYDAPRRARVDADESLNPLAAQRKGASTAAFDLDETEIPEPYRLGSYQLAAADFCDGELTVRVVPRQHDEFTCRSCFLVRHQSRLARGRDGESICTDCA